MRQAKIYALDFIGGISKIHDGIFHQWAKGEEGKLMGLVEFKDGKLQLIPPDQIQFDPPTEIKDLYDRLV